MGELGRATIWLCTSCVAAAETRGAVWRGGVERVQPIADGLGGDGYAGVEGSKGGADEDFGGVCGRGGVGVHGGEGARICGRVKNSFNAQWAEFGYF